MSQYYQDINDYLEDKAVDLMNTAFRRNPNNHYVAQRNNLNTNDIDIKIIDSHTSGSCSIDVQYSMNFGQYGDVRIDLMSAGQLKDSSTSASVYSINQSIANFENHLSRFKNLFEIQKYGKYFLPSAHDMNGVFYYFYNHKFDKTLANFQRTTPDFYFYLPKNIVLNEVWNNPNLIIKVNDKKQNGIYESHYSAFACLNIEYLMSKYNLPIFNNETELINYFSQQFRFED